MIEKIIKIRGIGLLHDAVKGAKELGRYVIIFGDNGRGKTTFSAVLSSLKSQSGTLILERKTIRGKNAAEVELIVAGALCRFSESEGKWSGTAADLLIFDASFIDDNVYSGSSIEADHRKNLHSFAIGEEGVKLAKEVDRLAAEITKANAEVTNAEKVVIGKMAQAISIEDFLDLEPLEEADKVIEEKRKYVEAIQQASLVLKLPLPSQVSATEADSHELSNILQRSFDELSPEVEQKIRDHIDRCGVSEK